MNCDIAQEKTADLVAGRLDAETRTEVEDHIAGCTACADFSSSVQTLYALDLDDVKVPEYAGRGPRRIARPEVVLRRVAAAVLVALVFFGGYRLGARRPTDDAAAVEEAPALSPVTVALPRFPAKYASTGWLESPEEARLVSRFTGRPLLIEYTYTECPRCQAMAPYFDAPKTLEKLDRFVLLRVAFTDEVPKELARYPTPTSPFLMMPALVISTEDMTTAPAFEIADEEMVDTALKNWDAARWGRRPPLSAEEYDDCAEFFAELPTMLERFAYPAVFRELEHVESLGNRFATAFAPVAADVRRALLDALERQAQRILRDIETQASRTAATKKAQALATALGDTDLAKTLRDAANRPR